MINLILSTLILTANTNQPSEIIGYANTPSGVQKEIIIKNPSNDIPPFSYIPQTSQQSAPNEKPLSFHQNNQTQCPPNNNTTLITSQTSSISPTDMNPIDYKDKIENTIYQSGDRLILIQSIPLKYIKEATTPNIQPIISDFPSW